MHFEKIEIALNLPKSINENHLISRDISSLDRILDIYFSLKNRNISDEKKIINFLFQFIDLNGNDGSALFHHLDKIQNSDEVIIHRDLKPDNIFLIKIYIQNLPILVYPK